MDQALINLFIVMGLPVLAMGVALIIAGEF